MSFVDELKRRNVFRVGIAYAIAAWLLLQMVDVVMPIIGAPDWVSKAILLLIAVGFPLALLFAWAFELTPDGLKFERDVDRSQRSARSSSANQVSRPQFLHERVYSRSIIIFPRACPSSEYRIAAGISLK